MQTLSEIIQNRRTIHHFTAELVPESFINEALRLTTFAPNHRHTQPVKFYKLGPETKVKFLSYAEKSFADRDPETASRKLARWSTIPGWILVTRKRAEDPKTAHEDYATLSIALYIMMQSLSENGVGTKWSTGSLLFEQEVYDLFQIDAQAEQIEGMFWYGYPEKTPLPFPKPDLSTYTKEYP